MQADIGARMSRWGTNRWRYLCATEGDGNQEKRCEGLKQTEIDNAGLAGYDEWRGHGTPDASDPDYGEIIYDKGSGSMGSDDPFDESRW